MQKKVRGFLLAVAVFLSVTGIGTVWAEGSEIDIKPDYIDYSLTITGTVGNSYNGSEVNIQILRPIGAGNTTLPEITISNMNEKVAFFSSTIVVDGAFKYVLKMDESAEKENPFWARVNVSGTGTNEDISFVKSFSFTSQLDVNNKLEYINEHGVTSASVESDAEMLGIELPEVWGLMDSENQIPAAAVLITQKATGSDTLDMTDIVNIFEESIFKVALTQSKSPQELKSFVSTNDMAAYFNIDTTNSHYVALSSDKQTEVFGRVRSSVDVNTATAEVKNVFLKGLMLESIENQSYKNNIPTILNDFQAVISVENMNAYKGISDTSRLDRIHSAIINASSENFTTIEKFEALFKKAIEDSVTPPPQNNTNYGGSSGGGSGGYSYIEQPQMPVITPTATQAATFKDVSDGHWAYSAIMTLKEKGIVSGKGEDSFCPSDLVTREEAVKMICDTFGIVQDTNDVAFDDIRGKWFEGYVNSAYKAGIVSGIGNKEFGAGEHITREDILVMIMRAWKTDEEIGNISFVDSDEISGYAKTAVSTLAAKGIISGYPDGSFKPKKEMSRAEAAVIIYSVLSALK